MVGSPPFPTPVAELHHLHLPFLAVWAPGQLLDLSGGCLLPRENQRAGINNFQDPFWFNRLMKASIHANWSQSPGSFCISAPTALCSSISWCQQCIRPRKRRHGSCLLGAYLLVQELRNTQRTEAEDGELWAPKGTLEGGSFSFPGLIHWVCDNMWQALSGTVKVLSL